jgi:hypothetical protein
MRGFGGSTQIGEGLAALHAAPELPLGRDDEMLVKGIGVGGDFHPLSAITDSTAAREATTHMLC